MVADSPTCTQPVASQDKGRTPAGKEKGMSSKHNNDSVHRCTLAWPGKSTVNTSYGSTSELHFKRKNTKRIAPLVETEARRSTRLKNQKGGFMRKTCVDNNCLACDAVPPLLSSKIIKNLCLD